VTAPPPFFDMIRRSAAQRWDQLESDPDLAAPWHQLFKQVQSPRHILSELLQNADDAGASEAWVRLDDQSFVFEHNGEDFTEEHFASLCRFGYSNKRALHTIGFRGIGFKSTFSLGDSVQLFTPSLSVVFHRQRFTQPHWLATQGHAATQTRIQVPIRDGSRHRELEKNLDEWRKSPASLLFFRNIRCLRIGENELRWGSMGPGPVPDSEWMALDNDPDEAFLLIRSAEQAFPDDALAEIRDERLLGADLGSDFPPCRVEIVVGMKGRLYVVLPTGVETSLPFACNAPFIQDPARLKIKDPETSPTNHWLLRRAGELAAESLLRWLGHEDASQVDRADAYALLPNVDHVSARLEDVCGAIAASSFQSLLEGKQLLLADDGHLCRAGQAIALPAELLDVWPAPQLATLLDEQERAALSRHVAEPHRKTLSALGLVEIVDREKISAKLRVCRPPKPEGWYRLMKLWAYLAHQTSSILYRFSVKALRVVPVQGQDELYSASEVVRLGDKRLLQSEDDWRFLSDHVRVMNPNWQRFLAEQQIEAESASDKEPADLARSAHRLLDDMGLDQASEIKTVFDKVSSDFFASRQVKLKDAIRLAQIAAKLNVAVSESFRYVTRDGSLKASGKDVLYDPDGLLEPLLPDAMRDPSLLHPDYTATLGSCSRDEWKGWVSSGRAGLLAFVPIRSRRSQIYGKRQVEELAIQRGHQAVLAYRYVTNSFCMDDWDFEPACWLHWKTLSAEDGEIWARVFARILDQPPRFWSDACKARLLQIATTGSESPITTSPLLPAWILQLRNVPCLPDTRGIVRRPDELLRRTPDTEALIDVEPFVDKRLDTEATRPLLDLLGVRSTPTGPGALLDRLRALAHASNPPASEIDRWYRRLDQMIDHCSTEDFQAIKDVFSSERLILTHEGAWAALTGVFLNADEDDVPGAALVRPAVEELTLWRKIGVADRPTADRAIKWLMSLPSGSALPQADAKRVRALLTRHPGRVWHECRHWINLAGEWTPVERLDYALTMQSLTAWGHLHGWVKQATADLQRLPIEIHGQPPFCALAPLSTRIEERLQDDAEDESTPVPKPWLRAFAEVLRRVELDVEEESQRVRELAMRLHTTHWREVESLQLIPYLAGRPAGTPRAADVVWLDRTLYVTPLLAARLARRVPEEIGRVFNLPDIKAALDFSFERPEHVVRQYLEANFRLAAASAEEFPTPSPGEAQPDKSLAPPTDGEYAVPSTEGWIGENSDSEPPAVHPPHPQIPKPAQPHPPKAAIIDRFAAAQGFRRSGDEGFVHSDGRSLRRNRGEPFPWVLYNLAGVATCYFLPSDHCLETEALVIEADAWGLIERQPAGHSLVLLDTTGQPTALSGTALLQWRDQGRVSLHPARYRLVYDPEIYG